MLAQVLLLDEVTVDLDVVARMDLLDFFKEECEQVKAPLSSVTFNRDLSGYNKSIFHNQKMS